MLKFFNHLFDTKGLWHAFERSLEVIWRFALGGRRLDQVTNLVETTFRNSDFRMTFFVSAGAIRRHRGRIERLRKLGHDIGSHGIFHSRMDLLSPDSQSGVLIGSHRMFREAGFGIRGFRPPYLNYNHDTRNALRGSQFKWTSGEVIFWDTGLENGDSIERLGPLYHFHQSDQRLSLPSHRLGVLDIPVTAPDDEILFERYRLRENKRLQDAWCKIFKEVHARGELFHILFHPERFPQIHTAVNGVIDYIQSRSQEVWLTHLDELAEWWNRRSKWNWNRVGDSKVRLEMPEDATLLLHERNRSSDQITGAQGSKESPYKNCRVLDKTETYPAFTIGLSKNCPTELKDFLHSEGFLVEFTEQPQRHSLYLENSEFSEADARRLLEKVDSCEKPLLRLWRWPAGRRSAFCLSADICAVDLRDFWERTRNF